MAKKIKSNLAPKLNNKEICSEEKEIMMIIWLNGAFGAGKTTIAHELQQNFPTQSFMIQKLLVVH